MNVPYLPIVNNKKCLKIYTVRNMIMKQYTNLSMQM
jgi:hypothetical protein